MDGHIHATNRILKCGSVAFIYNTVSPCANYYLFEEVDGVSSNIRRQRDVWYVSACYVYFLFLDVFSVICTTVLLCLSEFCAYQRKLNRAN
jgi:hypothetical protein